MSHDSLFYLRPLKTLSHRFEQLIENRLWLRVLIALAAGVITGLVLGPDLALFNTETVNIITAWLALPGQVFLALIQMIVVPLVLASIVRGLAANNNPEALKKIGSIAIVFILLTTAIATSVGIGLSLLFEPGNHIASGLLEAQNITEQSYPQQASFPPLDQLPAKMISLLPINPLSSMVSGQMLQVILFAALLGVALLSIPPKQAQPLFDLLGALQEVSIRVVSWAMKLAPLAVFGLITKLVANLGMEVLTGMLIYVATVVAGLLVMTGFYCIVILLTGKGPLRDFFDKTRELLLLAFSTSSSAAVMPLTLQSTENRLGVRPEIARFLVPLGATINMTGTALYQGAATVFLAQVFNVELGMSNYVFIVTMAVAASIGSPATPGAGIVILSMVLEGVGIPATGIALLLGVDRILDMCRTAVNVLGDVTACLLAETMIPPEPAASGQSPPP